MLWACLSLPFHLVITCLQVVARWSGTQAFTTCFQIFLAMFYRSLNLNMHFPYFLNSCRVSSSSSSILPGPSEFFALVTLVPFHLYFLVQNTLLWFCFSGGLLGAFSRGLKSLCPSPVNPSPSHSRSKRRRCRCRRRQVYHRHYHCRVKFLHHPCPLCPKLPTIPASLPCRFSRRLTALSTSLVSSVTSAFTPSSCFLVLSGVPASFAIMSLARSSTFIHQAVSWYVLVCCFLTGVIFA